MSKIIIAGGGTGGHIFPAIAIANALKQLQPGIEILFVGANGKMEMEKIPQAGYDIKGLDITGYDRSSLIKNFLLPFRLIKSFDQVRKIVKEFIPDAVVGVGGYSSFPVLKYAQSKKIPTFIHESNSFAGKTNIMLGKKATKIFTATDGMENFFPAAKIIVTGNPVRKNIVHSTVTKQEALKYFGLNDASETILVFGGSLGARSINEVIASHLQQFNELNVQLIWQTGKATAAKYIETGGMWKNVWVNDFIAEMDKAYAASDAVISRAGAMAVAELCVVKKPVIFVPYPLAAEDHQTVNAKHLADKSAAIMIVDKEVNMKLFPAVIDLVNNQELQEILKKNIAALAVTDADEKIAVEILQYLKQ